MSALGLGLGLGLSGAQVSAQTGAAKLLGAAASGWFMDFRDNSMVVRDPVTPANNYEGAPAGKVAGTALRLESVGGVQGLLCEASDAYYLPASLFGYSAAEFSLIAKASMKDAANVNCVIAALNSSGTFTGGSGALLRLNSQWAVSAGGNTTAVSQAISPELATNEPVICGAACRDSDNKCAVSHRGLAPATIATLDWTGGSNRVQLGALTGSGGQPLRGHIYWLGYVPVYDETWIRTTPDGG